MCIDRAGHRRGVTGACTRLRAAVLANRCPSTEGPAHGPRRRRRPPSACIDGGSGLFRDDEESWIRQERGRPATRLHRWQRADAGAPSTTSAKPPDRAAGGRLGADREAAPLAVALKLRVQERRRPRPPRRAAAASSASWVGAAEDMIAFGIGIPAIMPAGRFRQTTSTPTCRHRSPSCTITSTPA